MIRNGYLAVNSGKTVFNKTKGSNFIIRTALTHMMGYLSYRPSLKLKYNDLLTKPPALQLGPFEQCLHSLLGEDPPRRDDRNYLEDQGLRRGVRLILGRSRDWSHVGP